MDAPSLPAGAGALSTAEEQAPVTLELLKPSQGRSGERRPLRPGPDQMREKLGSGPPQREDMAVSKVQAAAGWESRVRGWGKSQRS